MIGSEWEIDEPLLSAARAGRKEALARVLARFYPQIWRIAVNLTGSRSTGERLVRRIMTQAMTAAQTWDHESAPARWFRHHTILETRRYTTEPPPPGQDVLVPAGERDPAYAAFVRALRSRPPQQQEAFMLQHGEGFDMRNLGVAMDCSVEAAGVHLHGANHALRQLAGDQEQWKRCLGLFKRTYEGNGPDERMALPYTRRVLRGGWAAATGRAIGWLLTLALLGAAGYAAWLLWPRLEW